MPDEDKNEPESHCSFPQDRVYCGHCRNFCSSFFICKAVKQEYDTPFWHMVVDGNPKEMNKNNDCKLFQKREEKKPEAKGLLDRFFLFVFGR
jgi:hypothetical protein